MRDQRVGVGKASSPGFALAFFAYLAFAVLMTHPLFFWMKDHTLIFPVDSLLNTWILTWDYHALGSRPLELFNANIFYPARNSLALSEHMIGNLPIFAPLMFLTQNPILAANGVVFASFVLSGISMFALVRYWTGRVILHTNLLTPDEILRWQTPALAEMGLGKVAEFGSDVVFQIATFKSEGGS